MDFVSSKGSLTASKRAGAGSKALDLCRRDGFSEQTLCGRKARNGALEASELQRLRQPEDENRGLKRTVADLTLRARPARGSRGPRNPSSPRRWASENAEADHGLAPTIIAAPAVPERPA